MSDIVKIIKDNYTIKNEHVNKIDISGINATVKNSYFEESIDDGALIREGGSATFINCYFRKNGRRGLQADFGHKGFSVERCHSEDNQNDGFGTDGPGFVKIKNSIIQNNGKDGQGSRDGIQCSGYPYIEILNNWIGKHSNAALIGQFGGGKIIGNYFEYCMHGIGCNGNKNGELLITANQLYRNQNGFYFYEESPETKIIIAKTKWTRGRQEYSKFVVYDGIDDQSNIVFLKS